MAPAAGIATAEPATAETLITNVAAAPLVLPAPPRAVRIIELGEDGSPACPGLLIVEVGCRLVFNVRPNHKMDMVSVVAVVAV
jgi:hypothetical protein